MTRVQSFITAGVTCAVLLQGGCATLKRGGTDGEETGVASYYHDSLAGRPTASGEPYNPAAATCAHKTHRLGTRLKVTRVDSGLSVVCRVNDRGPFVAGRVVDLSRALATKLGITKHGLTRVRLTVLSTPPPRHRPNAGLLPPLPRQEPCLVCGEGWITKETRRWPG